MTLRTRVPIWAKRPVDPSWPADASLTSSTPAITRAVASLDVAVEANATRVSVRACWQSVSVIRISVFHVEPGSRANPFCHRIPRRSPALMWLATQTALIRILPVDCRLHRAPLAAM
ncbi:unnamed protein product [Dibothriocephalus latus]|uniref:Uncharacterized protein n=1 Tax=Dibothriocephalus latus TaxID=60516 RepID=A0A3P6Q608_DIBLA|nr:unnamed protein product [Dibothriocephalus latus]